MFASKFIAIICFQLYSFLHPVHVAIFNFEYSSSKKEANITIKFYPDDLELAFNHNYNVKLNIGKANMNPEWKKYLTQYFEKTFLLKTNNKTPLSLVFDKYEITDDGIVFYSTTPIKGKLKSIQMKNGLLLDIFENQTNLVIFSIDGKEKGYNLNFMNYAIDLNL